MPKKHTKHARCVKDTKWHGIDVADLLPTQVTDTSDGWIHGDAIAQTVDSDDVPCKDEKRKEKKRRASPSSGDTFPCGFPCGRPKKKEDRCHHKRRRSVGRVDVGRTAFVDGVFGSDRTGRVQRQDLPFRTWQAAVDALAEFDGSDAAELTLEVRPGTYIEDVTFRNTITVVGDFSSSVVLKGRVRVVATDAISVSLARLTLDNVDAEALIVDTFGGTVDANEVVLRTTWTRALVGANIRTATARVLRGFLRLADSDVTSAVDSSNGNVTAAALVSAEGTGSSVRASMVTAELDVASNASVVPPSPIRVAVFDALGATITAELSDAVLKISGARSVSSATIASADASSGAAGVSLHGIAAQLVVPGVVPTASLMRGVGAAALDMDQSSADLTAVVPASARLLAEGIAAGGAAPNLSVLGAFFPKVVPAPPVAGTFASSNVLELDGTGAMVTTGGVRAGAEMVAPAATISGPLSGYMPTVMLTTPATIDCVNGSRDFDSGSHLGFVLAPGTYTFCLPALTSTQLAQVGYVLTFSMEVPGVQINFVMRDGSTFQMRGRTQSASTGANMAFGPTGTIVTGLLGVQFASLMINLTFIGDGTPSNPTRWDIIGITTIA